MNTRAMGNRVERHAQALLKRMHFRVEPARPLYTKRGGQIVSKAHDFFTTSPQAHDGLDLVAKRPRERCLWLQIKSTKTHAYSAAKALRDSTLWDARFDDVHVWLWHQPERHGAPGHFQAWRIDEDFQANPSNTFPTNARHFPWEEPPPPTPLF